MLHREGDQPAIIWATGAKEWYLNGWRHREGDQPAVVWSDGTQSWYVNGLQHRSDGKPAVVRPDGVQQWWTHGRRTCIQCVTDFRERSDRYALVQAVARVGLGACDVVPSVGSASTLHSLLAAVQVARSTSSYHVGHEYAFLVALFL